MTPEIRRARTAFWWVGVIVPLAMIALASIAVIAWLPEIPEPAAIHWGAEGPDGFGPGWTHLVVLAGVGGGLVVLFVVIALGAHRLSPRDEGAGAPHPRWSPTARLLGAASLGVAGLLSALAVMSVGSQRGLADAVDAPNITPWVFGLLAIAVALSLAGWFLQPPVPLASGPSGEAATPLPLSDHERAVWVKSVSIAKSGQIVLGIGVFLTIGMGVLLLALDVTAGWIVTVLAVLLLVLVLTGLTFRVRASAAGLRVRSAAGWPRLEIPAAEIARVRAVMVDPFAEFGGWGYRIGTDGRRGFVLRAGDALEVTRTDGRVFVVTVDDAATAASVLAAAAR